MSMIEKALQKLNSASVSGDRDTVVQCETIRAVSHFRQSGYAKLSGKHNDQKRTKRHCRLSALKGHGKFVTGREVSELDDEYRRIKRPLLTNAFGNAVVRVERGNLIMVTSALPGEGKTYTSINLALSMALEHNHTVLLVDADVTKSDISRLFDIEGEPGLIDVLVDEGVDLSDVLVSTGFHNLTILPSGRKHTQATEVFASETMIRLSEEIASRYTERIIIFDSPPLLPTTEAQVLSELMGQIVVVVEANRTQQHIVEEALSTLDSSKAIGLVLNKAGQSAGAYHSGYYGRGD